MSDFLYPFLSGESEGNTALLTELERSAREKVAESASLRSTTLSAMTAVLDSAAAALAARFATGGRLYVFGNGGSSTDAAALAALFAHPPSGSALPARTLTDDAAVLTALANDVGYDRVFSRQIIALTGERDMLVGLSTSGSSRNIVEAFDEARARGLCTIGFAGYDGGTMARSESIDYLLVVRSDSVHRIQEVQAALAHELWRRTIVHLGSVDV